MTHLKLYSTHTNASRGALAPPAYVGMGIGRGAGTATGKGEGKRSVVLYSEFFAGLPTGPSSFGSEDGSLLSNEHASGRRVYRRLGEQAGTLRR